MTNGERFKDLFDLYVTEVWAMPEKDFLEWLNTLTTATEPVKHGQWLSVKVMDDEADFGETDGAECSVCGYSTNSEYWAKTYYHYCPNCGAKMDEVEE